MTIGNGGELLAALVAAAVAVEPVPKASTAQAGATRYSYRSTDDVVDACRQALLDQGVLLIFGGEVVDTVTETTTQSGARSYLFRLRAQWRFVHASTRQTLSVPITSLAWGSDARALGAARSYAQREALQRTLMLPTGERDVEERDDAAGDVEPPTTAQGNGRRKRRPPRGERATVAQQSALARWLVTLSDLPDGETKAAARDHWHTVVGRRRDPTTFTGDEATRLLNVLDGMAAEVTAALMGAEPPDPILGES